MSAYEFPWPWAGNKFKFNVIPFDLDFRVSDFKFAKKAHPVSQQINCLYEQTCCSDVIDSLHPHNISICPSETYTLPDQSPVKGSGTYYVILKSAGGCDSVVYYNVTMEKSPADLTTSPDTCLNGAGTIQLRALEGYGTYYWNNISSTQSTLQVTSPGTYTVHVENKCGTKTNTIVVYDHCDFPVYFPNAFTPNNDRKNDVLRFPAQNKNKLRRLNIYNRWGQLVFSTSTAAVGWDGTMRGVQQPAGEYVYFLETETFSGQILRQKGVVILER
jgi:gliding motility-associated-like protein